MGILVNIIWTLMIVGIIIFFHELGHFLAAKKLGIMVERFSIGFGPKMIGFTKGDTEYRISWLPFFGGYVKMLGENPAERPNGEPVEEEAIPKEGRVDLAPVSHRAIIAVSGPAMNIVLAIFMFAGAHIIGLPADPDAIVTHVEADSPASKAGMMGGDRILSIDGYKVKTWNDIRENVLTRPDEELEIALLRDESERISIHAAPERIEGLVISIALDLQGELDNGIISEDLGQEFGINKIPLSPYAIVSVEAAGTSWLITDGDSQFPIRKEDDKLEIYAETRDGSVGLAFGIDLALRDDLILQNGLDSGIAPEVLGQKFKATGNKLSGKATILVEEAGSRWLINDRSYGRGIFRWLMPAKDRRYFVRRENGKLNVYLETGYGVLGVRHSARAIVRQLEPDSIAAEKGLRRGDVIKAVDHAEVEYEGDFIQELHDVSGESVTLTVRRDAGEEEISVPVEYDESLVFVTGAESPVSLDNGAISEELQQKFVDNRITLSDSAAVSTEETGAKWLITDADKTYAIKKERDKWLYIYDKDGPLVSFSGLSFAEFERKNPITALAIAVPETIRMGGKIFQFLKKMIMRDISFKYIAGPVGIVQIAMAAVSTGMARTLQFAGFLSVNLGIVNMLPLFITDGAMIVFLIIEGLRRKPMSLKKQLIIQQVGVSFIILLFLLITYNDIIRLVTGGL